MNENKLSEIKETVIITSPLLAFCYAFLSVGEWGDERATPAMAFDLQFR